MRKPLNPERVADVVAQSKEPSDNGPPLRTLIGATIQGPSPEAQEAVDDVLKDAVLRID